MATNDPFIAAARQAFETSAADLRASLVGLGADGLNWRPEAQDTNSVTVLASHALGACRAWVCMAAGAPAPDRSREAEFQSEFESEERALAFVDDIRADTLRILDEAGNIDWASTTRPASAPPDGPQFTRAFALLHAIDHLREHVAHLQLTRQLWDARV